MPKIRPDLATLMVTIRECGSLNRAADALDIPRSTFKRWAAKLREEGLPRTSDPVAVIEQATEPPPDWEQKLWESLPDWETLQRAAQTEVDAGDITIETERPIGIAHCSDWHIGNAGTHHALIKTVLDTIMDTPGLFFTENGDCIDNYVAHSHETGRFEQILRPGLQKRLAAWLMERLAPKLLAVTGGQHEFFEERVSDFDTASYLARKGGAVYLGAGGALHLRVGEQLYTLGMWHRYRGSSVYDRNADAKRAFRDHGDYDVIITGDKHEPAISHCVEQGAYRVFVRSGTAKLTDRYGKSLGYTYTPGQEYLATPVTILWPDRREFATFLRFDQAVAYLRCLRGESASV